MPKPDKEDKGMEIINAGLSMSTPYSYQIIIATSYALYFPVRRGFHRPPDDLACVRRDEGDGADREDAPQISPITKSAATVPRRPSRLIRVLTMWRRIRDQSSHLGKESNLCKRGTSQ